ncbi:sensor histidine kinase [Ottowia testudinis]|uniref:histidine kinase n=1 Tax=Ottowia testudinis TaxID=2816950 RepID=A0A975CLX3_9BURK|nr:HAMP domain-containing sensor histidine kinase [Ottowia testudinis]QTD46604.1 HAMP domain-containing histidine kinase [Ottowia testudinis]
MRTTADAIARFTEADWVEAARLTAVVKGMAASQLPALVVVAVMAMLSYAHASRPVLLAVLALAAVAAVSRRVFVRGYLRFSDAGEVEQQLAYAHRRRWFLVLNAVSWGVWPLVFYGRLPAQSEVVCWMLTAGIGGVAITSMSAHLRVYRRFLMVYLGCVAASVAVKVLLWPEWRNEPAGFWFPAVLGGYWLLLLRIAKSLNEFYSRSIDLAYHNMRLIHSLQEQTRVAQEAVRFKDRFLAGAAHDLKQPVSALGIYAEWLSNEPDLVDELGPKILQSTQAINALFDSLFDLVKLDAGRFEADIRTLHVRDVLDDLEVQFKPMATQKGLQLRVHAIDASFQSDPIMLRRIVGNLVANAIRYTAQGGVLLAARRRGEAVAFEVWDTGIGIAEHEQSQIYEEFYKVPASGTEEGFGLGLAIVRRLSQRLGYPLSLRSRLGRGTMFRLLVAPQPRVAPLTSSADRSFAQSGVSASGF